MGKKIASLIFITLFGLALYIFYSKDDKDLRESVKAIPTSIPRVTLKNFESINTNLQILKVSLQDS